MKVSWSNFVKDYLSFSRKERRGIAIIVAVSILVFMIPRFVTFQKATPGKEAFQAELAQLKISVDTSNTTFRYRDTRPSEQGKQFEGRPAKWATLFSFDPNTLDEAGWKKLGIREKTITTIQHFIAKGFRFRKPDDLRKIYGLPAEEADRLVPYVQIISTETAGKSRENHPATITTTPGESYHSLTIDINAADTAEFISLPGIGSKLAARIVNFRQKLGGFYTVDQVAETYGIPDSTFQVIKVRLKCMNPVVTKVNVNTATANELKVHPYIRWNIANAIVNYRTQHGTYNSLDELRKIEIINEELFNKITPYLAL